MKMRASKAGGLFLKIEYLPSTVRPLPRLGVTVSRKYGHAVERNRFKRWVKEAFRQNKNQWTGSFDINVYPTPKAKSACFRQIQEELLSLLKNPPQKH